jgi:hypothetical protein
MKAVALLAWIFLAGVCSTPSLAQNQCEIASTLDRPAFGFVRRCGEQIRSWALTSTDPRWRLERGYHGVWFTCWTEPSEEEIGLLAKFPDYVGSQRKPCIDEPSISGGFILGDNPSTDPDDELTIMLNDLLSRGLPGPRPPVGCQAFDVSVGGIAGRATCIRAAPTAAIIARFREDRLAFFLIFSQQDKPLDALKEKVQTLLANQFTIERGTGDAALLRWMQ